MLKRSREDLSLRRARGRTLSRNARRLPDFRANARNSRNRIDPFSSALKRLVDHGPPPPAPKKTLLSVFLFFFFVLSRKKIVFFFYIIIIFESFETHFDSGDRVATVVRRNSNRYQIVNGSSRANRFEEKKKKKKYYTTYFVRAIEHGVVRTRNASFGS